MKITMSGHSSSYGECWIEDHGTYYMVILMGGEVKRGPYSQMKDAMKELLSCCPNAKS